ncbi:protein prune homolog 2 isoform X2 [Aethina tumida]|uniref:protein prune homolog 2 isoform X2 n=1 Tax=Aethina tumida TaxID=116153 RepID=UPI0021477C57|nr:protein prune homolog 2 isoform X2 [Aethina tumida]
MDNSDSSQDYLNSSQNSTLPLQSDIVNENRDRLSNTVFFMNLSNSQNATNSHPLMSPTSPVSPDYPDLIPEKPKAKSTHDRQNFNPKAHSTPTPVSLEDEDDSFVRKLNEPLSEYDDTLSDFPDSPTALKRQAIFDFPVETTHEGSDNENDKSVYEAHLSSNLQNVALTMNEKEGNLNFLAHKKRSNKLRRISVMSTNRSQDSDESSLASNSDSVKSEEIFAGEGDNSDEKVETDDNNSSEPIEPLSAAEERKHARHWQRTVLPSGEQRTIDMRVIEPYKRVLSHGGYLRAGGHTAIVLFSACYLPDKSRVDYDYVMDNLFLYVLWTLERLVTEDYVLVYLHGGATKLPSFSWLKKCYQLVGRKLRKNLSHLYLVHPSLWIKTMLFMAKPFISSKFYRKIVFMGTLRELMVRVPLEAAAIPEKVKLYDSLHRAS